MNQDVLVSFILTTYNSEKTVKKSIESILDQSIDSFKLFIVDDGSTDETKDILNEYEDNPKIELIFQSNQGVSAARNTALRKIKSKYVTFLDSDDEVDKNFIDVMLENYQIDIDLVAANFKRINTVANKSMIKNIRNGIYQGQEAIKQLFISDGPQGFLWNKLFKMEIIRKNNLSLNTDVFMAEDLLFCVEYLSKSKKFKVINDVVYNYYPNNTGKTDLRELNEKSIYYFKNFLLSLEQIDRIIPDNYSEVKYFLKSKQGLVYMDFYRALHLLNQPESSKLKIRKEVSKFIWVLLFSRIIGLKKKIILLSIIFYPKFIIERDKKEFINK